MSNRKSWTIEEDRVIRELAINNDEQPDQEKMKWSQIAQILNSRVSDSKRTGKQCRQRWHNQLHPNIKGAEFSSQEILRLFSLQNQYGNKWAKIAKHMPGRTDNNIKNFFYSSLRRALRQINIFVSQYKKKSNIKPFKPIILTKVLNINDEKYKSKLDIKTDQAIDLAQEIKDMLGKLSQKNDDDEDLSAAEITFREGIVQSLQQFNKCCKKRKDKKKNSQIEENYEDQKIQKEEAYIDFGEQNSFKKILEHRKTHDAADQLKSSFYKQAYLKEQPPLPVFPMEKLSFLKKQSSIFSVQNYGFQGQNIGAGLLKNDSIFDNIRICNDIKISDPFENNCEAKPTLFASIDIGDELQRVNNEIFDSCFFSDRDDQIYAQP